MPSVKRVATEARGRRKKGTGSRAPAAVAPDVDRRRPQPQSSSVIGGNYRDRQRPTRSTRAAGPSGDHGGGRRLPAGGDDDEAGPSAVSLGGPRSSTECP